MRDGVQLGAVTLGDHERAVVRRRLDEHAPFSGVAGDDEVKRLQRPVRDQDLIRCNAVVLGQPLTQRLIAADGTVVEQRGAVSLENLPRAVGELGGSEQLRRGHAAGERDRLHRASLH